MQVKCILLLIKKKIRKIVSTHRIAGSLVIYIGVGYL